ncbi:unnamed protein product [Heligmosomoides polygyrus]|uniref:Endo/exonuclease/phosphatase domain-containing protein n=1 Tax=Heligmosomoides polygyrus TaxID=6339 RepID=A0A183G018_HELPZ|nr:unnamed protein product [Heligmosomoides polygyrus]
MPFLFCICSADWQFRANEGRFWSLLVEEPAEVPSEDMVVVAGDLNGHVGATKDGTAVVVVLVIFARLHQERKKKAAKKAVAAAKAAHYADVSEKLETSDGQRYLYRLAKARCCQAEDIEKFSGINDENGHLLMDRKRAVKRWRDYSEEISNVEFEHPAKITVSETATALTNMKSGKATGPDDLPADL